MEKTKERFEISKILPARLYEFNRWEQLAIIEEGLLEILEHFDEDMSEFEMPIIELFDNIRESAVYERIEGEFDSIKTKCEKRIYKGGKK